MSKIRTYRMVNNRYKTGYGAKYGNRRCQMDGYTFDSVKEMNRYVDLKYLLLTGKIENLELHKPFVLDEGFRDIDGKWHRDFRYIADFVYFDIEKGETIIEDVKSEATRNDRMYKHKKRQMLKKGLRITEV